VQDVQELPSAAQLVELVHHYLPANIWESEPGYDTTPEYQRLKATRRAAWETGKRWTAFLGHLRKALPHCRVQDWSLMHMDNCWRVRVYLPQTVRVEGEEEFRAVVGMMSILAPVAVTYTSFQRKRRVVDPDRDYVWHPAQVFYEPVPDTREYEEVLLRMLGEEFGVRRLPNETLFTPVPDIQYSHRGFGEARLIDCLFTDDLW
jgi:hypothetical protein